MPNGLTRAMSPETRFFARVHKTDTCWLWTGANDDGSCRACRRLSDAESHRRVRARQKEARLARVSE